MQWHGCTNLLAIRAGCLREHHDVVLADGIIHSVLQASDNKNLVSTGKTKKERINIISEVPWAMKQP
jgi:hypothetical protein